MPLRLLQEDDLKLALEWRNAPEVRRNMFTSHETSWEEHKAWFAGQQSESSSRWYIHEDSNGQLDGVVYFTSFCPEQNKSFWGFYAGNEAGPGIGTKMAFEAMELAFTDFKLRKLNCDVLGSNQQVINQYRKFGFQEEGRFREEYFDGENYVDVIRLGLLASEWQANRANIEARIAKLDTLAEKTSNRAGRGGIVILSDKESWINPWVYDLAEEWMAAGYQVQIAHEVEEVQPADVCFCLSFSKLVPKKTREKFGNTLVVHESDLPEGRGWSPMSWQIIEGKNRIPVTLFEAVDELDAGPIYLQEWIELNGGELSPQWRKMQAETTVRLCQQFVDAKEPLKSHLQQGEPTTYSRRRPKDSQLDPDKSIADQFLLLRLVDNKSYPAFFELNGQNYKVEISMQDERISQ